MKTLHFLVLIAAMPCLVGCASRARPVKPADHRRAALGYTNGPIPYGYDGLGELVVFIFFGLVATAETRPVYGPLVMGAGPSSSQTRSCSWAWTASRSRSPPTTTAAGTSTSCRSRAASPAG